MWQSGEISLAYLTVDGATPEEHVAAAAGAGFDAAGLRILPPTHLPDPRRLIGDVEAIARLAVTCRRHGIRPLDAEVMSLAATTSTAEMTAMADTAAALDFRFVQTVIEDEDLDRAAHSLSCLAEITAAAGLGVALEFMAFRPLSTLEAASRMIATVGAPNVGLLIDALHLDRAGGSVEDVAAIPPEQIAIVQLCDAPAEPPGKDALVHEARNRRLHPGEGALPLHRLLDVLPDNLPLSLEVPHPDFIDLAYAERARQAMDALRAFLNRRSGSRN